MSSKTLNKRRERMKGIKFAFGEPDSDMVIVSMLEFQGMVYVATQKGIYWIEEEKLVRLEIVDKTPSTVPIEAPESPVEAR